MEFKKSQEKLIPLRKFSVEDIYSPAYLSQLVQRGKLKAKRIGRNYYTCQLWFSEYLEQHAHDAKYDKYQEYLSKKSVPESSVVRTMVRTGNNKFAATWKQIAISMAVFLLFLVIGFGLYISYNQGRIAGVEEQVEKFDGNIEFILNTENSKYSSSSADVTQTLRGFNAEN